MQQENATAATQKVKEGVSSLLGGISKALVIAADDDYQLAQIVGGKAVVFDRYKVLLLSVMASYRYLILTQSSRVHPKQLRIVPTYVCIYTLLASEMLVNRKLMDALKIVSH